MTAPTTLYEVRSYAKRNDQLYSWSSHYERDEAEQSIIERTTGARAAWAEEHHRDWHIEEIDVSGMFKIPPNELPRDRFTLKHRLTNPEGWGYRECALIETHSEKVVAEWTYKYAGRPPYEPFRQGDRYYALMATHYTGTSVMDLETGEIVAAEPNESHGFCPVGFYVPDWWDVHDGSIKPGSWYWRPQFEKPDGSFGFVWGCVWGDDSSWKVQYLDLSRVAEGEIKRDDRFGYVELADLGDDPREFIRVDSETGRVTFATWQRFKLEGKPEEE